MTGTLEIVRAGAGSGKTTDLCETVADAVREGLDPARIMATTFTRKAAAELKGRIQAKLLEGDGNRRSAQKQAERLELAAIGTVHSVAHSLLRRYAIEMGLSPRLEVVAEHSSDRALHSALRTIPPDEWRELVECARRLGIEDIHGPMLALLTARRGNRISDASFRQQMADSADRLCQLLAPEGSVGAAGSATRLKELTEQALNAIGTLSDTTKVTKAAYEKLSRLCSESMSVWSSYPEACRIKAGKTSGADAMLDPLRNHAAEVRRNPLLHDDVRRFATLLTDGTLHLDDHYQTGKIERGLVDYTDLEILLLELLEHEQLTGRIAEDFDLVLVDEFQDTNPLQLAIFQCLRRLVRRSRWVGDHRQAVYGFRGTDPQLVSDIWENTPDAERTGLHRNFRSQQGLVQLVGKLFTPEFGDGTAQEPHRPGEARGVERWILDTGNQRDDAQALACGIARLHREEIPWADIAVLERTHQQLQLVASALAGLGIPYLLQSPGLFSTWEGAMLLAGLRIVADRRDSLAAATVLHLLSDPSESTPQWFIEGLERKRAAYLSVGEDDSDGRADAAAHWLEADLRLSRLALIDRRLLSPSLVAQEVIEALELPALLPQWGEPARRCAALDSVIRHAQEYEEQAFSSGRAATLSGLILHLEQLEKNGGDTRHASAGHDAVTLMTYHAAKGLEWPVVVLSGLDFSRDPDMWSPVVSGGGSGSGDPLEGRTFRAWSWPFGRTDGQFGQRRTGTGLENDALSSPEGQERTSQEQEESLRLLYVGCTRARNKLVFAHRAGKYTWLERLPGIDTVLDPDLGPGEHELDEIDTTLVVRNLDPGQTDELAQKPQEQVPWIAAGQVSDRRESLPRFHSPSQVPAPDNTTPFDIAVVGEPFFPSGAKEPQYAAIGDAVHSYLAALPSLQGCDEATKTGVAERCLAACSVSGLIPPYVLCSAGERLCQWIEKIYPDAAWHAELPVSGPRSEGGQWDGTVDLCLQLPDGTIVLIDHKSAPIRRDQCAAKAAAYAGQLAAYREILQAAGETVQTCCIHFPLAGVMAVIAEEQHH